MVLIGIRRRRRREGDISAEVSVALRLARRVSRPDEMAARIGKTGRTESLYSGNSSGAPGASAMWRKLGTPVPLQSPIRGVRLRPACLARSYFFVARFRFGNSSVGCRTG